MSATSPINPNDTKTLEKFNFFLSNYYHTVIPEADATRKYTSSKFAVFEQLFGKGVFGPTSKELTSTDGIIFLDTAAGTPGKVAEGFTESFYNELITEIDNMSADQGFKDELRQLFIDNPGYKDSIKRATDALINAIINRRAQCKILLTQEAEDRLRQRQIDLDHLHAVYEFIDPPTPQAKYKKYLTTVKDWILDIDKAKIDKVYKKITEVKDKLEQKVGNSFSILAWAGIFSGVRGIFGKIPLLLGPIPLKHIDYVEIARSGKILKFRASGSVFLAKQEGASDAIKIEGLMYKAEYLLMFALWGLFIYGQSKFKDMENIPNFLTSQAKSVFEVRKLNDLIMTDTTLEKPSYEFHQTFPFVSRHFIIPNCYIETIVIEDKLPLKDVLKYSILLRTYDKPKEVSWIEGKKGKVLYGIKNKSLSAKMAEVSLNAGWRLLNQTGWLIDETDWKIGSAMNEGVIDTYYDVDWTTIATVSYLTLMGVMT